MLSKDIVVRSHSLSASRRVCFPSGRFGLLGSCVVAFSIALPAHAADSDGDGISDSVEGYYQGFNNGFESPVIVQPYEIVPQSTVPDWGTDASDAVIEIWQNNYNGVPSYAGDQHAEINANKKAALFLDAPTVPGTEVTWKIAHRGRLDQDSATVALGAPGQPGVIVETMVTGPSAWQSW